MFQGMKSGDEMQVNVRIVGCVNPQDCSVVSIYMLCGTHQHFHCPITIAQPRVIYIERLFL